MGLVSLLNGMVGSVVRRAAVCAGLGLLHLLVEILGKSGAGEPFLLRGRGPRDQ